MKIDKHIKAFVGDNYVISTLAEMSIPCKMAIVWYMAIDSDMWECEWLDNVIPEQFGVDDPEFKAIIEQQLPRFMKKYGKKKFGFSLIDAQVMKDAIMHNSEVQADFKSWEQYAAWYTCEDTPSHSEINRWPVILSCDKDELLQDGNHRFHSYMKSGHSDVPAIFFIG